MKKKKQQQQQQQQKKRNNRSKVLHVVQFGNSLGFNVKQVNEMECMSRVTESVLINVITIMAGEEL